MHLEIEVVMVGGRRAKHLPDEFEGRDGDGGKCFAPTRIILRVSA